jgi:dTMP kinase
VADWLDTLGHDVVLTDSADDQAAASRSSGSAATATSDVSSPSAPAAQALLNAAVHADYVARVIRPVLDRGGVVVCDGFHDDVQARSVLAGNVDTTEQMRALRWGSGRLVPHLTVVLDDSDAGLDDLRQLLVSRADRAPDRYVVLAEGRGSPAPSDALRTRVLDVLSTYGVAAEPTPSTTSLPG